MTLVCCTQGNEWLSNCYWTEKPCLTFPKQTWSWCPTLDVSLRLAIPEHNEQARVGGDYPRLYEVPADSQPQQHSAGGLHRGKVYWRSGRWLLSLHLPLRLSEPNIFKLCVDCWGSQRAWSKDLGQSVRANLQQGSAGTARNTSSGEILLLFHSALPFSISQLVGRDHEVGPTAVNW